MMPGVGPPDCQPQQSFPSLCRLFPYVLPRLSGPGRVKLWQEFCQKSQIGSGVSCPKKKADNSLKELLQRAEEGGKRSKWQVLIGKPLYEVVI